MEVVPTVCSGYMIDWLIDYSLFYVPLKNISLIWRHHHYWWRAAKLWPMLTAQGLWAGRDIYRATSALTQGLGFSGLIRRTAPFSCLLQHTRGCGGYIIIRILMGPLSIISFDTQGDAKDLFLSGSPLGCLWNGKKIMNSNQSHKSYRKYKSENGRTRTYEYIRGGIRCHGLIDCTSRSRIFHLYGDVIIADEGLQNLGLCSALRAFGQGGIFIVPHLLWHGTSVFPVSSEGSPQSVASYDTWGCGGSILIRILTVPWRSKHPLPTGRTRRVGVVLGTV
jgi:hypothetical protein